MKLINAKLPQSMANRSNSPLNNAFLKP